MFGRAVFEVIEIKECRMVKEWDFEAEKNQNKYKTSKTALPKIWKTASNQWVSSKDGWKRYESWVEKEIALKPDDLSSAGCGRIAISSHKFGSYKKPFISFKE